MNRIIRLDVRDEFISGAGQVIGAAGSHDDVELELAFSPMWAGTAKKIVWFDALGENAVVTALGTDLLVPGELETYRVPVPPEAKAVEGDMRLTIRGVNTENGVETRAVAAATACFRVLPAQWDPDAVDSSQPTASQADQLRQELETIKSDIADAAKAADALTDTLAAQAAAEAAQAAAESAKTEAVEAATSANQAATSANQAATAAGNRVSAASDKAQAAASSAQNAASSAQSAEAAKTAAQSASSAAGAAQNAAEAARYEAEALASSARQYAAKPPRPQDGTWWIWNAETGAYEDSGVSCELEGPRGVGVESFAHTAGNHAPGTTDTYTVTLTDGSETAIPVYNGRDGDGGTFYAVCTTAGSTAAKTAACAGFTLKAGAQIMVKFTYANTASSPTLNVNGTGAKSVKKYGTTGGMANMWAAGAIVLFVYDGTYWVMENGTTATTTYYGLTKLNNSTSSYSAAEAATANAVRQAYQRADEAYGLARDHEHGADRITIDDETAEALGMPAPPPNLVTDGDFSDTEMGSPLNWISIGAYGVWSDILSRNNGAGFSSGEGSVSQNVTLTDGHMHYFRMLLSCTDAMGEASVSVSPCGVSVYGVSLLSGLTTPVSGLFTPTLPAGSQSSAYSTTLSIEVTNGWGVPVVNEVLLVDLTEAFGAGKEPDKDWCDKMIAFGETDCVCKPTADMALKEVGQRLEEAENCLPLSGGDMTGMVDMQNHVITGLPAPVAPGDAVNYQTLINAITGITSFAVVIISGYGSHSSDVVEARTAVELRMTAAYGTDTILCMDTEIPAPSMNVIQKICVQFPAQFGIASSDWSDLGSYTPWLYAEIEGTHYTLTPDVSGSVSRLTYTTSFSPKVSCAIKLSGYVKVGVNV